jgi:hypothetical protein
MAVRLNQSRSDFSLTVDLRELFGEPVSEDIALSFGQGVIDTITDRLDDSKRLGGGKLKNYSDEYSESLVFKAFGKSRTSPNLELTGEMLADLDIIEVTPTRLKIGFRDTTQRDKAYNHHTGDTVPARPFLGLEDKELKSLVERFKPEVSESILDGIDPASLFLTQEVSRRFSLLDVLRDIDGER